MPGALCEPECRRENEECKTGILPIGSWLLRRPERNKRIHVVQVSRQTPLEVRTLPTLRPPPTVLASAPPGKPTIVGPDLPPYTLELPLNFEL